MFDLLRDLILEGKIDSIFSLCKGLESDNQNISPEFKDLLSFIASGRIDDATIRLEQLFVKYPRDQSLFLVKDYFKRNKHNIKEIHSFMSKFDNQKQKISMFVDGYFLIGQEVSGNDTKIQSLEDLKKIASNPSYIYNNGKIFEPMAVSTLQKFMNNILPDDIKKFMRNVDSFEALYYLFEKINEKVQKVFSEHRIGIYLYNNEIYFIKYLPLLQLDSTPKQSNVTLLDNKNSGTIIGVKFDKHNNLGDVVQFEYGADQTSIVPKFCLDVSMLLLNKNVTVDFSSVEGLKRFCDALDERIDTIVSVLCGNKQFSHSNPEDIKIYTEYELQKLQKVDNLHTRVTKLSYLLQLKQSSEMYSRIKENLEDNYIYFIDFLMNKADLQELQTVLKKIETMKIFETPVGRKKLLNILSLGLSRLLFEPSAIISMIEQFEKKFPFQDEDYQIFSTPYIRAMAKLAPSMIFNGQFEQLKNSINIKYLNHDSELISIFVSIMVNISYDSANKNLPIEKLIELMGIIFNFIKDYPNPQAWNQNHQILVENYLNSLIKNSQFMLDLLTLKENLSFLEFIISIKDYIFKDPQGDLKCFLDLFDEALIRAEIRFDWVEFKEKKNIHRSILQFYKKSYPERDLDYLLKLILEFNRISPNTISAKNLKYFISITEEIFKQRSATLKNPNSTLISLVKTFLEKWYLDPNSPSSFFYEHYMIIENLGVLYEDKNKLEKMKRNVKLNEALLLINHYQNQNEIESKLEEFVLNHTKTSELFEQDYFTYLKALLNQNLSIFFNFSCSLFHLKAVQRVYKGQKNDEINEIFKLFEKNLLEFFQNEINHSSIKTVREYLDRIENFVPSMLKNVTIYTTCLESVSNSVIKESKSYEHCLLYKDLYERMSKFSDVKSAKPLFISVGFEIFRLTIVLLSSKLQPTFNLTNTEVIYQFLNIFLENLHENNRTSLPVINSINDSLEELLRSPLDLEIFKPLINSLNNVITEQNAKRKKNIFTKTCKLLNQFELERNQREEFIKTLKKQGTIEKINEMIDLLKNKVITNKPSRYDYHILVLACIKIKNYDLARKYAIDGMNLEGIDGILEKIINNFLKITDKKEFNKLKSSIRPDLVPYLLSKIT